MNLDCTEEAAQEMAEEGSVESGGPAAVGGNTLRPDTGSDRPWITPAPHIAAPPRAG